MRFAFAGSTARSLRAHLAGDVRSIDPALHDQDRIGFGDRSGVMLIAQNGNTHSVHSEFDQSLPPAKRGCGTSAGSDFRRASIPVSALTASLHRPAPFEPRVHGEADETDPVESTAIIAVAPFD